MSLIWRLLRKALTPHRCANLWGLHAIIRERALALENERLLSRLGGCGRDVRLHGRIRVSGAESMALGDNVHLGENAFIRAEGGLEIGDNTHISRNVVIYTVNHNYRGERLPYDEQFVHRPVRIGENVWIGINVTILPGATIGEGAIVGAGSCVRGEVPPLAIVAPQDPAVLKFRDRERYHRLSAAGRFGGPDGKPYPPDAAEEPTAL
ncbi:MAG: acyltransferase [Candidatus Brocadiia bacterium]